MYRQSPQKSLPESFIFYEVGAEVYLEPCQTSKMESFAKIFKTFHLRYLTGLLIRLCSSWKEKEKKLE